MTGLAQLLKERGIELGLTLGVTAHRDPGLSARLARLGLRLDAGSTSWKGPRSPRALVYPHGIEPSHPDRLRALRVGIEQRGLGDALEQAVSDCPTRVVVLGHSTRPGSIAARVGWALVSSGDDPRILLSQAAAPQLGGFARAGAGPRAVVEGIPGSTGWSPALPSALVLSRGAEHRGWESLRGLLDELPESGVALVEPMVLARLPRPTHADSRVQTYGLESHCTWRAMHLKTRGERIRTRFFHRGRFVTEVDIQALGPRGVRDSLAAAAVLLAWGFKSVDLPPLLESFRGMDRQVERLGRYRGISVVDDAAETPKVARLAAAYCRRTFPGRRLVVLADLGYPNPFRGGEVDCLSFLSTLRTALAVQDGRREPEVGPESLDQIVESGDVLLTLGSSTVRNLADAFLRRLPRSGESR